MDHLHSVLKRVFGYDSFRPHQAEIISAVLGKKDVLAIMPTGSGKSLCYQIPAILFNGLTVVVSPLLSLMKDQVEQLASLGVPAQYLNSSLSCREYLSVMDQIRRNEIKLLYVAPETLLKPSVMELLSGSGVECLAIDEAHCISHWGHDFRPEYRKLASARSRFPEAVCIAITATATPRVQADIRESLKFTSARMFISSFDRHNLFINVIPKRDPVTQTIEFLKDRRDQSGIIYCFSRRQVDTLYQILSSRGFAVKPYHAGLPDGERIRNQEMFIRDEAPIIVATIAFGLGINKPNVRFVLHYDLPQSIEHYYQEIGRAGRDGLPAHCLLLYGYGDIQKIRFFIDKKEEEERQSSYTRLKAMVNYAEYPDCRRGPLLSYFGEKRDKQACGMCDNCSGQDAERTDITSAAQKFLSCVKRTGEMYGATHIIDVLRGSQSRKVMQLNHHHLSTYGTGREHTKEQWQGLCRQFIRQKLLRKDFDYGSLQLLPRAYDVFSEKVRVWGTKEPAVKTEPHEEKEHRSCNLALLKLLKEARLQLARKMNAPAYVIFPDKTLIDMAERLPRTKADLANVYGVGAVKLDKYGDLFLLVIREYVKNAV